MRAPSRDPTPPWFKPIQDRLSPTITTLVVANTLLYVLYAVVKPAGVFIQDHLVLGPDALRGHPPQLWQLVTSLFFHQQLVSWFFDVLGIWFVGATIERQLGRTRFLTLFLVPGVLSNLVIAGLLAYTGSDGLYAGCGAGVLALFVAFGRLYDRTPARILGGLVMEARTLTFILVGFALLADLMNRLYFAFVGDVVAVVVGYLLSGGRGAGLRELFTRFGRRSSKRRFSVVEGGRPGSKEDRRPRYLN